MSDKTPLILLPGLLCDGALWRHQIETLADIAEPSVGDLTGENSVEAMARSVLAAAPDRFSLAGLSMGGYVAQEIMRQAPDRVRRLALVDTAATADSTEQTRRRRGLLALSEKGEFRGVTDRLLPLLIHESRLDDTDLTIEIKAMAERVGKEAFGRQQRAIMNRPDGRRDLGLIRCPAVVIAGRQDTLTPLDGQIEMAGAMNGAKLVVIEDCGHLSPLEQPAAVSAVLRYWLQT